jgi:hypothetical protein
VVEDGDFDERTHGHEAISGLDGFPGAGRGHRDHSKNANPESKWLSHEAAS